MITLDQFLKEQKINIEDAKSPCGQCWRRDIRYSEDNPFCKNCEYNIVVKMLKIALKGDSGCQCCKYSEWDGYGYCCSKNEENESCWKCNDFTIDLDKTCNNLKDWFNQ